ncbi:MAG: hypothetical protein ABI867_41635, partial [Kofleriaceae bacterium]
MPRFESARDFWEIELCGRSLTTRTGRHTTSKATTATKRYTSEAAALLAYATQIVAKTRNRFTLVRPAAIVTTRRFARGDARWEITLDGATVRSGKQTRTHATPHAALVACGELVAGQLAKGF